MTKLRLLKNPYFDVIARSDSDVAIYNILTYIKARLLRFARNDTFSGVSNYKFQTVWSLVLGYWNLFDYW